MLRVELGLNPDTLSTEEWAQRFQEWVYVQRIKQNATEAIIEKVVHKELQLLLKQIYGK